MRTDVYGLECVRMRTDVTHIYVLKLRNGEMEGTHFAKIVKTQIPQTGHLTVNLPDFRICGFL